MDAWVCPKRWSLRLFAVESLSKVFWRNYLGTTPFLIQFKSTHVSNKTIVFNL
jgi:hypothetical protein